MEVEKLFISLAFIVGIYHDARSDGCQIHVKDSLTFRHRASSMLGQAFRYSPENAFYIFNQQIYFII